MFWHLILGLLRDGQARHGYELMLEYGARSGKQLSAGNFYRELARLTSEGLLQTGVNPPDADARRIPYHITPKGGQVFDTWLVSPASLNGELSTWLLFADRVPPDTRACLLDRLQEDLWMRGKGLARSREDALAAVRTAAKGSRYDPRPALMARRMKQIAAEVEFIKEFRLELEEWERAGLRTSDRVAERVTTPSQAKRVKGPPRR